MASRQRVAQAGASQAMPGSDHPYIWQRLPVEHVVATTALSDARKTAIPGGDVARLSGLKA
jgi:hypothetical protein